MKKIIIIISIIAFLVIGIYLVWKLIFLGHHNLTIIDKEKVTGIYDKNFLCGFIRSEEELSDFRKLVQIQNELSGLNLKDQMWIYSIHDIEIASYSSGTGLIYLTPKSENIDGKSIYLIALKKIDDAGIKYTALVNE